MENQISLPKCPKCSSNEVKQLRPAPIRYANLYVPKLLFNMGLSATRPAEGVRTMTKSIKRRIDAAIDGANREISFNAQGGKIAAALASEGYAGGYRDALQDVILLLNGTEPMDRRGYWRNEP